MRRNMLAAAAEVRKISATRALLLVLAAFPIHTVSAQQPGPMTPPPAQHAIASANVSQTSGAGPQQSASHITNESPAMPVEEIIQKFAEREGDFRKERDNFTYTQKVLMQELDEDNQPDGEFRLESDIIFTPAGKRIERVTFAPQVSLRRIILTQQDMDDIEHVQPFVLTSEELPRYDVKYLGREQIDEIGTYVFDVAPKKIEKGQRYFQGRIWVEDKDLQIVKTFGRAEGFKKKNEDSAFPRFETFRENIEGHYWFPTYTRADDVLHFKTSDVHIRMTIRYENYKRFGSTIKIGKPTQIDPEKP
ncbi:MAG TPA: hypothetical protein VFN26_23715 [Candidatus Acidoferrum sp.]|nr:hypothetical protein [Candidatus Acidoferrum sp.]